MRRLLLLLSALVLAGTFCRATDIIVEPKLTHRVAPKFTFDLKRQWPDTLSEGSTSVEFLVDTKGRVADASVTKSTLPEMVMPALMAVKKWRFKPATLDGRPTPALMRVDVWFGVSERPNSPNRETPPTFSSLADKYGRPIGGSSATTAGSYLYVTSAASHYLNALQPHLPVDLGIGDPADKAIVEPKPRLRPGPHMPRALVEKLEPVKFYVAAIVTPKGALSHTFILSSSNPDANDAMLAAMARWSYEPGTVDGERATFLVVTDYEVEFKVLPDDFMK